MNPTIFCPGGSAALEYAISLLNKHLTVTDTPEPEVTHLLLPIPMTDRSCIHRLLPQLPENITVIGGNLDLSGNTIDLLKDPMYLAQNAAITADCAIRIAGRSLKTVFRDCAVYILGWGRIGKCLAQQLGAMGARVTVGARKETDQATAASLGFRVCLPQEVPGDCRILFNTIPAPVLTQVPAGCIAIDLASQKGLPGDDVIWARGLPGKDAPESSGRLIADTVLRLIYYKEDGQ